MTYEYNFVFGMNLPSQATHNKAKINYILYYFVLLIIHLNITNKS